MKQGAKLASLPNPPLDWLVEHRYITSTQAEKANKGWYTSYLRYDRAEAAVEYAYELAVGHEAQKATGDKYEQFAYTGRKRGDKALLTATLSGAPAPERQKPAKTWVTCGDSVRYVAAV